MGRAVSMEHIIIQEAASSSYSGKSISREAKISIASLNA
ncbi:hypothetical protein EV130_101412 [Rhizobium azibense]|uniref:Uncharacterized protein n=1 Tax=Rhizobium azibense TaxID=1136135 RepID=A0A4R3R9J3_9HYPH|nr:hypothetical protein EV130_101412 [Rhizobium azibense]